MDEGEELAFLTPNVEKQFGELYQEQEAGQQKSFSSPTAQQDTLEQLESLYSEQEELERQLSVSDA